MGSLSQVAFSGSRRRRSWSVSTAAIFVKIAITPQTFGIFAVVAGPEGDLWLDTNQGALHVAHSYLGQIGPFSTTQYLGDLSVTILFATHDGVIWAGTSKGLFRFTGSEFSQAIPDGAISRIEEMPDGRLFLVTNEGVIEWDGAHAIRRVDITRKFGGAKGQIYHIHQDRTGDLVGWFRSGVSP